MRLMTGVLACCAWVAPLVAQDAIGVGMVQVEARIGEPLYFFGEPEFDALPDVTSAVDSITFEQGPWYVDIATAPPWLVPETLKLDYDLLLFRAHTVRRDFVEVVVNGLDGRTAWVARDRIRFRPWSEFLLEVYAVEALDGVSNPVRLKPLDHAAVLAEAVLPLRPLAMRGDWLQVTTDGLADRIAPTGWIRWRDGERLLVTWALLS